MPLSALTSVPWAAKAQTRIATAELRRAVAVLASPERVAQLISMHDLSPTIRRRHFRIHRYHLYPRQLLGWALRLVQLLHPQLDLPQELPSVQPQVCLCK